MGLRKRVLNFSGATARLYPPAQVTCHPYLSSKVCNHGRVRSTHTAGTEGAAQSPAARKIVPLQIVWQKLSSCLDDKYVAKKSSAKIKAMLAIAAVDGNITAGQHPIDVEGG